ncbi:MAG: NUDIX domain-containing protein, partial [Mesorhizobium sp.]
MAKRSAGLLIYRRSGGDIEVLLVHPGGPFWAKKDDGAWSIPKGLVDQGEDELAAARRETGEELGMKVEGAFARLGDYRQPGGKIVSAWSVEADIDVTAIS